MRIFSTFFILVLLLGSIHAQIANEELRATWVATVYRIDWPKSTDAASQKQELIALLDESKRNNLNAIFLQIRPNADAFYNSLYEPWSKWLTGTRGNDPGYDPLAFAIEEAHKRGIEVHGWMNPYRFESVAGEYANAAGNYLATHPDWILTVDEKTYFNPGIPEVTEHITKIVGDILNKYDIDGICFDDYFYPSMITNEDSETYDDYNTNDLSIADFRRSSINTMIKAVYDTVKAVNAGVRFGVSPAGIYSTDPNAASSHNTTLPAGIFGNDTYNVIYCDPLAWFEDGSIDYLSPQLYWKIGGNQDFNTLVKWWTEEAHDHAVQLYPSLASYRLSPTQPPGDGWALSEIYNQIESLRSFASIGAKGIVFFSNKNLNTIQNFANGLIENSYNRISRWPEFGESEIPEAPYNLVIGRTSGDATSSLFWGASSKNRFLVESFDGENRTGEELMYQQILPLPKDTITKSFRIYPINKHGKIRSEHATADVLEVLPFDIITEDNIDVGSNDRLLWNYAPRSSCYEVIVSENIDFDSLSYSSGLIQDTSLVIGDMDLDGGTTYYYKVKGCNGNGCEVTNARKFTTRFPGTVNITYPAESEEYIPTSLEITWDQIEDATSYDIQISRDSTFNNIDIESESIEGNSLSISDLQNWQVYFIHIRGINSFGKGKWSDIRRFKTTPLIPNTPSFLKPSQDAIIIESETRVEWSKSDEASGYQFQLSTDENFESISKDTTLSQYKRYVDYTFPEEGIYYARVCAEYVDGCTDWSDILSFTYSTSRTIDIEKQDYYKIFPNPAKDHITIERKVNNRTNQDRIYIFDASGKLMIKSELLISTQNQISITSLSAGLHYLFLKDENNQLAFISTLVKE